MWQFSLLEAWHFSAPPAHSQESIHADHIRMHQPDFDIMLMDGQEGYMVEVRFIEYLSAAKEMHGVNLD